MPEGLFGGGKIFVGVVHLPPLPGSPRWAGDMAKILSQATSEATKLIDGGADGIIIENFGDAPFRIGQVEPETVATMTLIVHTLKQITALPIGINVLRNDAHSALAIATATNSAFIRVNVHYGVMAADEGVVEGQAFDTLRKRRLLDSDVKILADILVKHAVPIGPSTLGLVAKETINRGLADGLIVSGQVTGMETDAADVEQVRKATPEDLLLIGSGANPDNVHTLLKYADGAIVGTWLKEEGIINRPIDPKRVKQMSLAIKRSS
ncbi:MAG: BtpA/SgcQ family protein [Chloroflexota bacterium]|nr:BtpA/SgcQ family protein [Chloroflexota bacterium]